MMKNSPLAVEYVYLHVICLYTCRATANILHNSQPYRKKLILLWDLDPWSILTFQDLCFTSVTTGKLPKRLGP